MVSISCISTGISQYFRDQNPTHLMDGKFSRKPSHVGVRWLATVKAILKCYGCLWHWLYHITLL